jgi:large subunit ribosomal protein L9
MAKQHELLLLENVENLGIVGDVVKVRSGYARNFLLPRNLATEPSDELISQLAERRAEAEREVQRLREAREQMIERLEGFEITLERSCNDQGQLYGSVTQQDIADSLNENGFTVRDKDVRLGHTIKRIDSYDVLIKPEQDLEATIKLWVVSDRKLDVEDREDMEFDNEGNLIERPASEPAPEGEAPEGDAAAEGEAPAAEAPEKSDA